MSRIETMPSPSPSSPTLFVSGWQERIPDEQKALYEQVVAEAQARGVRFAFGGAFAAAVYKGRWRDTKDMDLYVMPEDREEMIEVLAVCGMRDYFDLLPYDRKWIYRGYADGVIVDIIWAMANQRTTVDERWLTAGPEVEFGGETVRVVAPEELLWSKLYVMQRERCDWPDVLNLIHAMGPALDWRHLLERVGEDAALLKGVLSVFQWLSPDRAMELPKWLWPAVDRASLRSLQTSGCHADLLDSRPWFRATMPELAA
jgi:hypothetical protein